MTPKPSRAHDVPAPAPEPSAWPDEHALCEDDCAALEALVHAEMDLSRVPEPMRARAERLSTLFQHLECAAHVGREDAHSVGAGDSLLVDATLARCGKLRAMGHDAAGERGDEAVLSPRDEDALEALVAFSFNPAKCPSAVRERATRVARVLDTLNEPVNGADRDRVVALTLSRVQREIEAGQGRMRVVDRGEQTLRGRGRVRLGDLVSVAAMLVLGTAVVAPMVSAARAYSGRLGCQGNLSAAGLGFGLYASDYRDQLPLASASRPGTMWWEVGNPQHSNSANLFTLVRTKHVGLEQLACGGNPEACWRTGSGKSALPGGEQYDWPKFDAVSYSYQNMFSSERPRWTQPERTVVLADRSPVTRRAFHQQPINPVMNSDNHAGTGQAVLFNDGSARWMRTPVLENGDNIWLPRQIEEILARFTRSGSGQSLRGTETNQGADDVFLTP